MQILRHDAPGFALKMRRFGRSAGPDPAVSARVQEIIAAVRKEGDKALLRFTAEFDHVQLTPRTMRVSEQELNAAAGSVEMPVRTAIAAAHENVRAFAERSLRKSWKRRNAQGAQVGERFDPFQRVGIYVPAGTAPLVSTVLMTVTLAATAGVPEIVVASPCGKGGGINPAVAHALRVSGATEVYKVGGAQAMAALAYGTKTIARVVKIFGPGNRYVVEAKRQVFGQVAVDLLPGPSEILVIADKSANPAWIAADMLAQAEHGQGSSIALLTDSGPILRGVEKEILSQTRMLKRGDHLAGVLRESTWLIQIRDLAQAVQLANDFAPEHLSIVTRDADDLAGQIRTAGAIFLGGMSPVVAGDFLAGPSHELPTGGAGKSFAGLTVDQFQRRTSIVRFDERSLKRSLPHIAAFSQVEGLDAHGRSATIRMEKKPTK